MASKNLPSCPKCKSKEAVLRLGRRNVVYPAGCLYLGGILIASLHQSSSPTDYKCKTCESSFGVRTGLAKLNFILMILVLSWPLGLIAYVVFRSITEG